MERTTITAITFVLRRTSERRWCTYHDRNPVLPPPPPAARTGAADAARAIARARLARRDSFLPHGTWREPEAREQPILLTINDDNPNGAAVRFLVDGAPVPADAGAYQRIVLIFDGEDPDAVAAARERWSEAKASGFETTYWQADEQGRWQRKG